MNINIRTKVPAEVLAHLKWEGDNMLYSRFETVFHCIETGTDVFVGVVGDGANAAYEWFIYSAKTDVLQTSNCGYGSSVVALRDVLRRTVV